MAFSIDEHPLWVYAVDGHYIEPLKVDVLTLLNGDRYSIFVQLNKPSGAYGIRVAGTAAAQLLDTFAVLVYPGGSGNQTNSTGDGNINAVTSNPSINRAGLGVSTNVTFFSQAQMVSFPPQFPQPAPAPDQTVIMTLAVEGSSYNWVMNGSILHQEKINDLAPPLLWHDPLTTDLGPNVTFATKNNTWVDLVFRVNTIPQPPHPIHKHSNKGFIIGQGDGLFNWTSVAQAAKAVPHFFNFVNPPYRDGFVTPGPVDKPTWLAVRYHVVNPGVFMLHCHIQSHMEGGMAMVILDGVDAWPEVPTQYQNV